MAPDTRDQQKRLGSTLGRLRHSALVVAFMTIRDTLLSTRARGPMGASFLSIFILSLQVDGVFSIFSVAILLSTCSTNCIISRLVNLVPSAGRLLVMAD